MQMGGMAVLLLPLLQISNIIKKFFIFFTTEAQREQIFTTEEAAKKNSKNEIKVKNKGQRVDKRSLSFIL